MEFIGHTGPYQGANARYEFRIAGQAALLESAERLIAEELPLAAAPKARGAEIADAKTVVLVSCVARKQARSAQAKDLYVSDWFLKARRFAEQTGLPWFILSAQYGLVSPADVIAPYEKTLNTMGAKDRRAWGESAFDQLISAVPEVNRVVFLAGARYREFLADWLQQRGIAVDIPMEGLRIGEQLAWLESHARGGSPGG